MMNEPIDYTLNPDKYHTVPARHFGECDEQYKKRLKTYSLGLEKGAASRQAEIDAALKQRDSFIKAHHIAMNDVCNMKAKIDELQKRIDEALEFSENIHDENAIDKLYTIIDILKGATP